MIDGGIDVLYWSIGSDSSFLSVAGQPPPEWKVREEKPGDGWGGWLYTYYHNNDESSKAQREKFNDPVFKYASC